MGSAEDRRIERLEDLVEDLQSERSKWLRSVSADRHFVQMEIQQRIVQTQKTLSDARFERAMGGK